MPAIDFIPKFIEQTMDAPGHTIVTADRWNELFGLLITQGDYNTEALRQLVAYTAVQNMLTSEFKYLRLNQDAVLELSIDGENWTAISSFGHQLIKSDGSVATQRNRLKFTNMTLTDDGDQTIVTCAPTTAQLGAISEDLGSVATGASIMTFVDALTQSGQFFIANATTDSPCGDWPMGDFKYYGVNDAVLTLYGHSSGSDALCLRRKSGGVWGNWNTYYSDQRNTARSKVINRTGTGVMPYSVDFGDMQPKLVAISLAGGAGDRSSFIYVWGAGTILVDEGESVSVSCAGNVMTVVHATNYGDAHPTQNNTSGASYRVVGLG